MGILANSCDHGPRECRLERGEMLREATHPMLWCSTTRRRRAVGAQVLGGATVNHAEPGRLRHAVDTADVGATLFIQGQFPWQASPRNGPSARAELPRAVKSRLDLIP